MPKEYEKAQEEKTAERKATKQKKQLTLQLAKD